MGEDVGRGQVESGEGADGGTDLPHDGRGREAPAHDITDDQRGPARRQRDDVEPVATNFSTGRPRFVTPGDIQTFDSRGFVRQQAALQSDGGGALAGVGPGVGHRTGDPASQFSRGLHVPVGITTPGRADAEVDDPEELPAHQQRDHDRHVDCDLFEEVVRFGYLDAAYYSFCYVEKHWSTRGECSMSGIILIKIDQSSHGIDRIW